MKMSPEKIIERIKESGLTGRGGANFPTGLKWELTRASKGDRILVCNADEGEPGTFKDKFIIENNLQTLLQGIAIGGYVLDAKCFIYLRGEYSYLKPRIEKMIKKLGFDITVVTGAGAYICGEETSLLESIEGSRGMPRSKPPYPTVEGLWKKPTCINNVETLTNIPLLLANNSWNEKLRLFSLSGNLKKPGVYEIPLGATLNEVLERAEPDKVKAVCLGYSGGIIPFERFRNITVDNKTFSENSFMLGSCTMIVIAEMNIVKLAKNIAEFFVHESCGKCIPCRDGGFRILEIINKINSGKGKKELKELRELVEYIEISFCALGKAYGFTIKSAMKNFRKEFDEKCR
jgi:NADH:ubiquinone oxidoreductase subunit F (NADH-binding)